MTEYGQAFYGSDEIHKILGWQSGKWKLASRKIWLCGDAVTFRNSNTLYKLPKNHWFYDSIFKRLKKPDDAKPLADYSDNEITILARKLCADICNIIPFTKKEYLEGYCDKTENMRLAKIAIIAGMELQRGNTRPLCPDTLEAAAKAVIGLQHGEEVGLDNELECENNGYQIAAQKIRNLKGEA